MCLADTLKSSNQKPQDLLIDGDGLKSCEILRRLLKHHCEIDPLVLCKIQEGPERAWYFYRWRIRRTAPSLFPTFGLSENQKLIGALLLIEKFLLVRKFLGNEVISLEFPFCENGGQLSLFECKGIRVDMFLQGEKHSCRISFVEHHPENETFSPEKFFVGLVGVY